jgi:hypothetical protein
MNLQVEISDGAATALQAIRVSASVRMGRPVRQAELIEGLIRSGDAESVAKAIVDAQAARLANGTGASKP